MCFLKKFLVESLENSWHPLLKPSINLWSNPILFLDNLEAPIERSKFSIFHIGTRLIYRNDIGDTGVKAAEMCLVCKNIWPFTKKREFSSLQGDIYLIPFILSTDQ